jgi:F0F1-type ATP synthase membrane subunit b/b'
MDYKEAILENAWGGVAMDYGLLHIQLATPIITLVIIFVVYRALNALLFQPVLRTLENREQITANSRNKVATLTQEMAQLSAELEAKIHDARAEVSHAMNEAYEEGHQKREERIMIERQKLTDELAKAQQQLQKETAQARVTLQKMTEDLAEQTTARLLS